MSFALTMHQARALLASIMTVVELTSPEQPFTASPTFGPAPLRVHFMASVGVGRYSIYFGDGQTEAINSAGSPAEERSVWSTYHTYTSPGTYTAGLVYHFPEEQRRAAREGGPPPLEGMGIQIITVVSPNR